MIARAVEGMSNELYHSHDSLSKSGLDLIAKSPWHYKHRVQSIGHNTARVGTALHSAVLESKMPLVAPDIPRRSKADRQAWSEWMSEHGAVGEEIVQGLADTWFPAFQAQTGLEIVSQVEYDTLTQMMRGISRNGLAAELLLLKTGSSEVSIFGEIDGVPMRARPDRIIKEEGIVVDLKSTRSATRHEFRRSCASYRYHVQQAVYATLYEQVYGHWPEFYFVACDSTAPYSCAVYKLDDTALENGHYLMSRDIQTFIECTMNDDWPEYPNDTALDIPIYERDEFTIELSDGTEVAAA